MTVKHIFMTKNVVYKQKISAQRCQSFDAAVALL